MAKIWRDLDWAECPKCGDAVEVFTDEDAEPGWVINGDEIRCVGCDETGWISADTGEAWDNWYCEED